MKRTLTGIATAALVLSTLTPAAFAATANNTTYSDISGNFAAQAITTLTSDGFIHGFSDGTYRPANPVTRGQFVAYFMKAMESVTGVKPVAQQQYFADVAPGNWAFNFVGAAEAAKWINPYWMGVRPGYNFNENFHASRGDAASLFVSSMVAAGKLQMSDLKGMSPLKYAYAIGLFSGLPSTEDQTYMNRADAAVVLENIIQWTQGQLLPTGAVVSVTGASTNMAPNTNEALSVSVASASGQAITLPSGAQVTWSVDNQNGFINGTGTTANLVVTQPGTYNVTATVDGVQSKPFAVTVYGQAAAVKVTPASGTLVANGSATDAVTVGVYDANGNVVGNFNGTASVATSAGTLASSTVTITNGVGTVNLTGATSAAGQTATLTTSGLTSSNGQQMAPSINYGSGTVSLVAAAPTALSLTPTTSFVSANANNEDPVLVKINDQSGTALSTGIAQYVTFTITGPGSFQNGGTPVTTLSEYVNPMSGGFSIPVYAIQGQTGTIQVSASAPGLTSGSTQIQSAVTTAPANITLTSSAGTTSSGTPFTLYTVQLVDSNGHPVIPASADMLTISDNSSTTGGTLQYFTVSGGQPSGTGLTSATISTTASLSGGTSGTGTYQFAVENTSAGTSAATVSVKDALTGNTATAPYNFQTGSAAWALFSGATPTSPNATNTNVAEGQTATYTLQLSDSNGNSLSTSGVPIDVYFANNGSGATIGGQSTWSSANPYVVTTNAQGQAQVSVVAPSSAGSFELSAHVAGQTNYSQDTVTVQSPANYTTQLALNTAQDGSGTSFTLPTSLSAGQTVTSVNSNVYVVPENAVGVYVGSGSDQIQFTSSNANVLSVGGTGSVTQSASTAIPTIKGMQNGTATLTIKDLSNPAQPAITTTIAVNVGAAAGLKGLNPNGTTDTAYTYPASGVAGPFTLEIVDAGGNIVPAPAPTTLTAAQVESALGVTGVTGIRTSSAGSDVSSVSIPANQSTVQVWLDGVTGGQATTATGVQLMNATQYAPTVSTASVSGTTLTLTFNNPLQQPSNLSALASAFALENSSVTSSTYAVNSASVVGNTITLSLGAAPGTGVPLSLSYATSGGLLGAYGAPVQAITSQTVTNNN